MVGGAVQTQVDAKGDGRPRRILLAAVETDLQRSQRQHIYRDSICICDVSLTLFAGFDLSLSKILIDCCFDARAAILVESAEGAGQGNGLLFHAGRYTKAASVRAGASQSMQRRESRVDTQETA